MKEFIKISGVKITHPDKPLYPDGTTKLDIAKYYEEIAGKILPYLKDRPITLVRAPEGITKGSFYQRHPSESFPDYIERVRIKEKKGFGVYIAIDALNDILYLVNLGVLEFHTWGAKIKDLERPDTIVFDLDPDPAAPWKNVIKAAFELKDALKESGHESWVKTSGKKGLHVMVDIKPEKPWEVIKAFAKGLADGLVAKYPEEFTTELPKQKRKGKVFIDYLRNTRSASNVAPYSTRVWKRPTVSMPVVWEDLSEKVKADGYGIADV